MTSQHHQSMSESPTSIGNVHTFGEVVQYAWFSSNASGRQTNIQTNKQTDILITIILLSPLGDEVIKYFQQIQNADIGQT